MKFLRVLAILAQLVAFIVFVSVPLTNAVLKDSDLKFDYMVLGMFGFFAIGCICIFLAIFAHSMREVSIRIGILAVCAGFLWYLLMGVSSDPIRLLLAYTLPMVLLYANNAQLQEVIT